jgi:hypothetical protein
MPVGRLPETKRLEIRADGLAETIGPVCLHRERKSDREGSYPSK